MPFPMSLALLTLVALAIDQSPVEPSQRGDWIRTPSGLSYKVLVPGAGDVAAAGHSVTIHEITSLPDGTVVYDSRVRNTPVTFTLGANQVITGVDEGVTGMRVGERRRLEVPPSLSRRTSYPPNTPKDAVLQIDVELMSIRRR